MKTRGRRTFVLPRSSTSGLENQITSCIKYVPRKTYRLPLEPFLTLFPSDEHVLFMFAIYGGTSTEKKKKKEKIYYRPILTRILIFRVSFLVARKTEMETDIVNNYVRNFIEWKWNRNLKCKVQVQEMMVTFLFIRCNGIDLNNSRTAKLFFFFFWQI